MRFVLVSPFIAASMIPPFGMSVIAGAPADAAEKPAAPGQPVRAPEVRLSGDRVTLPIVMVREFPFIEAEVSGVRGKLMLDTGSLFALSLNDHRVPVTDARQTGSGYFGSGQTFAIRSVPIVRDIRIGEHQFVQASNVASQDATQLEGITPDFIGWLGYEFWQGYALKLDYARSRATFYRGDTAEYLSKEKVVAELPFELRKLPNHPIMPIRIGGVAAVAAFDTGQFGTLYTDEATKARWIKSGVLRVHAGDPEKFDLIGFSRGGRLLPGASGIAVKTTPYAAAAPIGLAEPNILTIGYGFLRQFTTVWDYRRKTIYLLRSHRVSTTPH